MISGLQSAAAAGHLHVSTGMVLVFAAVVTALFAWLWARARFHTRRLSRAYARSTRAWFGPRDQIKAWGRNGVSLKAHRAKHSRRSLQKLTAATVLCLAVWVWAEVHHR